MKLIAASVLPAGAAIELRLVGRINLDRVAFDAGEAEQEIVQVLVHVLVPGEHAVLTRAGGSR